METINTASMLAVGTVLNERYTVKHYLASGGFGNTYVAVNEFGEQVAVKEFFLKGINHRDGNNTTVSVSNGDNRGLFDRQRQKFKAEALKLRNLTCPHIVKVQSFFEQNGTSYYVMDYIDREAVRVVKTQPRFTPGRQDGQPVAVWYALPVNFKLASTPRDAASQD